MDKFSVHPETRSGDGFVAAATQRGEERNCFFCLEGWVFLGSLDHDGEEVVESIKCRKCGGTGNLSEGR